MKLGAGDDVGQVRAVREALGPEARIRVDANAAWSLEQAAAILAAIEPLGIELAEQPVETLGEMAELARRTAVPLAADEIVDQRRGGRGGGARAGLRSDRGEALQGRRPARGRAIARELPVYYSSALDGPVGIAAAAHPRRRGRAGRRRSRAPTASPPSGSSPPTIAAVGPGLQGDLLCCRPGPGLGVEIDEDALQAHRL